MEGTLNLLEHQNVTIPELSLQVQAIQHFKTTLISNRSLFVVKAARDAHILLSGCLECDGYEIVIGGDDNKYSWIRERQGDDNGRTLEQVRSCKSFKRFFKILLD